MAHVENIAETVSSSMLIINSNTIILFNYFTFSNYLKISVIIPIEVIFFNGFDCIGFQFRKLNYNIINNIKLKYL